MQLVLGTDLLHLVMQLMFHLVSNTYVDIYRSGQQ